MTWPKKNTMTKTNTKTKTKTNTFWEHVQRVTLETCDLWDIWSEWWGDMIWLTKRWWLTLLTPAHPNSLKSPKWPKSSISPLLTQYPTQQTHPNHPNSPKRQRVILHSWNCENIDKYTDFIISLMTFAKHKQGSLRETNLHFRYSENSVSVKMPARLHLPLLHPGLNQSIQ